MTLAEFTALAQQLLTLAALVGAVWSAFVFIRSVAEKKEAARVEQLKSWRKAGVHKLLHSSKLFMSIDEITSQLRSESFDTALNVKKNELTPEVVRLLLLEMLEAGTIQQLWGDHFGIKQNDPTVMNAERAVVTWNIVNHAFRLINLAPGSLDTDALYTEIVKDDGSREDLPRHTFALMLTQLTTMGVATLQSSGKWLPVVKTLEVEQK